MTVTRVFNIDDIDYKENDIKYAIKNNDPIEDKLNVIIVISNPCLYIRRYTLLEEFVKRFDDEENVNLFIVELIYKNQTFKVTDAKNKNHLQLKTDIPIWHKENMVNLGVKYLLPENYKAFAWIDADIEFESISWALDTLKILNGSKDVVQLFSHSVDMSNHNTNLDIFNGFGYSFCKKKKYIVGNRDFWHPGYAWAITRKAYEKIGGLYDLGVLGSGDNIMAMGFFNKCEFMMNHKYSNDYNNSMLAYQSNAKHLRLGYVPGVIRHHYHGSKKNRNYVERWKILVDHQFSPIRHLTYDAVGVLIPTEHFSKAFQTDILNYFKERKEDS